ncbi:XRE family transcriptional regulator [Sphaerisporangium album]|uniref:XRE family transcriptional regulator n=1 Tax=Sphaerisporangium album TaxID=509200 RepID=A0A367FK46_9ACTN|nr:helix-turn-helix transcriptional regulator [Sphaerisporangium album]RCG30020.1 XRE family transcriptional regulator [Sphaerisporangium album]
MTTTFGEQMRALLAERGVSLRGLAKTIHYDVGYLSKVANDHKVPSLPLAELLDSTLKAGGALVALVRPDARALTSPAGPSIAHRPTNRVAPELVDYFREQLAGHYVADRHLGALRLTPIVSAQYQLLCELADEARGALRPAMWALATGYAAFIGWLYQDGGDLNRSVYWHDVTLERAHRSLDPQLVGFALHNKAMLYADMGDGASVVDLAEAALVHESKLCAKVRVLALQQAAHGRSLMGGADARDECDRLLDRAAALVEQMDDAYPWGSACLTPHYLDVQRATCYVRLDVLDEALALWDQTLPAMSAGARRDAGVFLARQAQALAARSEPEQAVEIAGQVVTLVEETGSARMRRELQTLETRMKPWAKERPGRQLRAALGSLRR